MTPRTQTPPSTPTMLTPGPVAIPDFVMQALTKPVIPHRSMEFEALYTGILTGLAYLFQTEKGVTGSMIASGTGGMEVMLSSLFREKEEVLVVSNGKFSERWASYGKQLRWGKETLRANWGKVPTPDRVIQHLQRMAAPVGLVLTHCETSTGAMLDLEEVALAVKAEYPDLLIVVDAITSVGAQAFYFDAWQIDAALVAGQKALMNPAGTVAYALSEVARERLRPSTPGDYHNLYNYVQWAARANYPFTPPVSLLYGLQAALTYISDVSLPLIWNRTQQAARAFRQGLKDLGGETFAETPAASLTAFSFPKHESKELLAALKARGFWLSGGQGPLKDQILRISHMGPLADAAVMEQALGALASCLGDGDRSGH